jgi:hypothetical protein
MSNGFLSYFYLYISYRGIIQDENKGDGFKVFFKNGFYNYPTQWALVHENERREWPDFQYNNQL